MFQRVSMRQQVLRISTEFYFFYLRVSAGGMNFFSAPAAESQNSAARAVFPPVFAGPAESAKRADVDFLKIEGIISTVPIFRKQRKRR
jgi:hypothetical protein